MSDRLKVVVWDGIGNTLLGVRPWASWEPAVQAQLRAERADAETHAPALRDTAAAALREVVAAVTNKLRRRRWRGSEGDVDVAGLPRSNGDFPLEGDDGVAGEAKPVGADLETGDAKLSTAVGRAAAFRWPADRDAHAANRRARRVSDGEGHARSCRDRCCRGRGPPGSSGGWDCDRRRLRRRG